MNQLIECVANYSDGRNPDIIKAISNEIESVEGVLLLNVDPGKATNRTVMTFVGSPQAVVEAAFLSIKKASELIDMSKQTGEHPRMGATDVCPFVPIAGISLEETARHAGALARRVGTELGIPVYLYEAAQPDPKRSSLSVIRTGEYEGFFEKIKLPEWKPDFGPAKMNVKSGATVIGARDFLVAYNVNLNTKSVRRANSIAFDVREAGRAQKDPKTGKTVKDKNGNSVYTPGSLKAVKGIGWYIEEYGVAQVSMNLTNINITPVHVAFDEVCKKAQERGIRVTGSEIIGLIPLKSLLDAGRYFLKKQKLSLGISDEELVHIAVKSMGLSDLVPFEPKKRIIEYLLADHFNSKSLLKQNLREFANETASESPAPGGGSISAYVGSLGAALGTMVANLSSSKRGWDEKWEEFSTWAEKGQHYKDELLRLVDEDTRAFNNIMSANGLPKTNDAEINFRNEAIQSATKYAIEVPFKVMENAFASMKVIKAMAETGNPNSASDAGVGALCARTAVSGAFLNVKINAPYLDDQTFVKEVLAKGKKIEEDAVALEAEILKIVEKNIGK